MILELPKPMKIYAIGHRSNRDIFKGPTIEITEKVDGSQFRFGNVDGELVCCSKNTILNINEPQKQFKPAVETAIEIFESNMIKQGMFFFGETLATKRHNVLTYSRVPRGHIALFGGYNYETDTFLGYSELDGFASVFGCDVVPLVYSGPSDKFLKDPVASLEKEVDKESYLGGSKLEGVVVRNEFQRTIVENSVVPYTIGKYVCESFKEVMNIKTKRGINHWGQYCESYATKARWMKAIQSLRDSGEFQADPRSIGKLIPMINQDIVAECKEDIMEVMWKLYHKDVLRAATRGFPEWFKKNLIDGTFDDYEEE